LGHHPVAAYDEAISAACEWLAKMTPVKWRKAFPVLAGYRDDLFDYHVEDRFLESYLSQNH
jgi:hypothetical protein